VKQAFSASLLARHRFLILAVLLCAVAEVLSLVLAMFVAWVSVINPDLALGWAVAPAAALLLLNSGFLVWLIKTWHFLGLFARWPGAEQALGQPWNRQEEQALAAAGLAFDQGDFGKVPALLDRIAEERRGPGSWLGLGRALALAGRLEESLPALVRGGEREGTLRWLRPRGRAGDKPAYFAAGMEARLTRVPWMAALAMGVVLASAALTAAVALQVARSMPVLQSSFDVSEFQSLQQGRFSVYYHNPDFRDQVAAVADAALDHDLNFLGMPADTFGPGAVKLYLCDSEEEYRRRAPTHPSWEAGCAVPGQATVYLYRFDDSQKIYFEVILAHEIGHLCYFRLIGSSPDDWLNEGLADYLGYHFGLERAGFARQAWLQNRYFRSLRSRALPFDRFFQTDPHQLPEADVGTFYQQGFSVVYLLIEDYGREPFLKFLKDYNSNKSVDAALADAFPSIRNIGALATVWSLFYPQEPAAADPEATPTP
jgi:hypothetical protein